MTNPVTPSVGIQLLDHPVGEPSRSVTEAFGEHYRRALSGDPARLRGDSARGVLRASGEDSAPERRDNVLKSRDDGASVRTDRDRDHEVTHREGGPDRSDATRARKERRAEKHEASKGSEAARSVDRRGETESDGGDGAGAVAAVGPSDPASPGAPTGAAESVVEPVDPGATAGGATGVEISVDGEANSDAEVTAAGTVPEDTPIDRAALAEALAAATAGSAAEETEISNEPSAVTGVADPVDPGEGTTRPEVTAADQAEEPLAALAALGVTPGSGSVGEQAGARSRRSASAGEVSAPAAPGVQGTALASDSTGVAPVTTTVASSDSAAVAVAESAVAATGPAPTDAGVAAPAATGDTVTVSGVGQTSGGGEATGASAAATGGGSGPSGATVGTPSGPEAGSLQRVVDSIEAMSRQNPPRSVTLDFGDMHGLRVRLAVHAGGVQVTVTDVGAGANRVQMWEQQLSDLLGERGLGAGDRGQTPGGGDREPSRPWARPESGATIAARRVRTTRTDEILL